MKQLLVWHGTREDWKISTGAVLNSQTFPRSTTALNILATCGTTVVWQFMICSKMTADTTTSIFPRMHFEDGVKHLSSLLLQVKVALIQCLFCFYNQPVCLRRDGSQCASLLQGEARVGCMAWMSNIMPKSCHLVQRWRASQQHSVPGSDWGCWELHMCHRRRGVSAVRSRNSGRSAYVKF